MKVDFKIAILCASLFYSACGDPTIDIHFDVPERYKSVVQTVTLQVFEPPEGEDRPFSCDDLAFNKVDEDVMQASITQTINIQDYPNAKKVSLSGIDRMAYKILLAKGLDESGIPAVIGCEDVFEVRSHMKVVLAGEPTSAVVWLDGDPAGSGLVTPPLPTQMNLLVNDILGDPLPGEALQYTMAGPGGQSVWGKKTSDANGLVLLEPTVPERPGPSVLAIETRWQRSVFPSIKGFTKPEVVIAEPLVAEVPAIDWTSDNSNLPWPSGPAYDKIKVGRIGPHGEIGIAFINRIMNYDSYEPEAGDWYLFFQHTREPVPGSVELATEFNSVFGKNGLEVTDEEKAEIPTLGLVRGVERDRLILITESSWFEFIPGDPIQEGRFMRLPEYVPSLDASGPPLSIHDFGGCAATEETPLVLISQKNGYVGVYNSDSGESVVENPFNDLASALQLSNGLSVRNAGCIADQAGMEHPAVYVRAEGAVESQSIVVETAGDLSVFPQPVNTLTISMFAPRIELSSEDQGETGDGEDETRVDTAQLLLGRLGADSPEVARLGLVAQQDPGESYIEIDAQDPLVAVPVTIAAGDVDGDFQGALLRDVVGVFTTDVSYYTGEPADYFAHFILGSEHDGKRLSGTMEIGSLTAAFETSNMPLIWLLDCDSDGIDDLIILKAEINPAGYSYSYSYDQITLEFHLM